MTKNAVRCAVVIALYFAFIPFAPAQRNSTADLRARFADPPDDTRIMMRWWWFGPAVSDAELTRELRTMKEGGIGGVEVQPVYPLVLDEAAAGHTILPYLSPDFLHALGSAARTAKDLGMRFDLTLGSGWPYGGPQVLVNEAAGMLRVQRVKVSGDGRATPLPSLENADKLLAIFFVPSGPEGSSAAYEPVSDAAAGFVQPPRKPGELLFFIASHTGQQVKRAAVGAEGFVLDHYNRAATNHYLANVGDRLMQALAAQPPYAVFCDSLEVYGSDWASDLLPEFQRRRGYDLRPYLPALVLDNVPKALEIRHDWAHTLTELFNERFAQPLHAWAQSHQTLLRMQAYGIPPAALSTNALVDLPEGEGADWETISATRWASSASHIYGVPVTSSETWTWLHSPVFRATPLDMKAEADRHFLIGINQLIGHGWPYSPPDVEYPGWRFYAAAVFDEKNPWWTVMPDVAKYLQRVSFMLRQGSPANDVALYLPTDDAWANFRPGRVNLFDTLRARIGSEVVKQITGAGFDFDLFDDDALQKAGKIEANQLVLGRNHYRVVVLPAVERMPVGSYETLQEFVRGGGILIATRRLPALAPGFKAGDAEHRQVAAISDRLFNGDHAATLVERENDLGAALARALTPDVSLSPAAPEVGFVHRHSDDADIYFIANTSNHAQTMNASFRVAGKSAEWYDALTGKTRPATVEASAQNARVHLELQPYESRLLAFSGSAGQMRPQPIAAPSSTLDVSHDWRVTFADGRAATFHDLHSWTDDDATRFYSGTATYEKTVTIPATALRSGIPVHLNLGAAKQLEPQPLRNGMQAWLEPPVREAAVVYVNGKRAGSLWCPPYDLDISALLHAGENTLRIEVANLAVNHMAGHALPDYRLLNLRYGVRFEAQDMDKVQAVPAGIFGPVRIVIGEARVP